MNIIAPKLEIDIEATEEVVRSVVSSLKAEPDSFAILSKDDMSYVQILMTEEGLVAQFQNGSLDEHYEFSNYLSRPQTIRIMLAYLNGHKVWQGDLEYTKINIGGLFHSIGLNLGRFIGGLIRGFKDARKKT